MDAARREVATCRPDETLTDVRARVAASGLGVCVVTTEDGVVFGLLRADQLSGPGPTRAVEAMIRGPSTFRPNVPLAEMAEYMTEHDLASAPITSSDGRLIGLLLREDVVGRAAEERRDVR